LAGQSVRPRREACDDKSSCRAIRRVNSADGRSDRLHRLLSDVGDDRHAIERLCRGCVDYLSVSGAGVSAGFFSWKRSPGLGAFSLPMTGARSHGPFSMSSRSYSRSNDSCGPIDSLAPDPGRPLFGRGRKGHVTRHAPRGRRMGGTRRVERRGRQSPTCLATTRPANPWGAAGGYSFAGDSGSHQPRQRPCALSVGRFHAVAIAFHV
jgi:hypothetical protein